MRAIDFKVPYNRSAYLDFFRDYLMPEDLSLDEEGLDYKTEYIQNAVKLADVPSLDLTIYEVHHKSEHDPRVSLSRDTFRMLSQYGKSKALIIFTSKAKANYRFSLVTIDLEWKEGKRVKKEYSNPRRYSFYLGPDTKTHTPEEYLIKPGRIKDIEDLKKRFSIEVVNKEFYTEIALLFTQLAGGKRTIGSQKFDEKGSLILPSTSDENIRKEFSVRLIGRLVFCWFLKKKLSKEGISLLPDELLSAQAVKDNENYYHKILEFLFFQVLNNPVALRNKQFKKEPWARIPFLNGGLFTPHLHDFYDPGFMELSKHINTLKIPDKWFLELFEIFETYNFTIDENTSIDIELSIDPEMLGRIFENLLAEINPETGETARKATGSYYTPRPIVEYMVDQSLKEYLLTKTKIKDDTVRNLLAYEKEDVSLKDKEREEIIDALDSIKIIDPACGSGAFPMGCLQKMLLILQKLDPRSSVWLDKQIVKIENPIFRKEAKEKLKSENVSYIHKLGIIQSAIYGVDIQPIAVEISKLRFFLSLIVDEKVDDAQENRGVEPLPNLEFKFVCANSLIGLPKRDPQQTMFEATDDISLLKSLRDEYLSSYGEQKKKIEKKCQETQSRMFKHSISWGGKDSQTLKLSQWNPFSDEPCTWFDPEWMFGVRGGFDIVIANPPYVRADNPDFKKEREVIMKSNQYETLYERWDLFVPFIEKGLKLLGGNGNLCYITSNSLCTSKFAFKILEYIQANYYTRFVDYFDDAWVFEAGVVPLVFGVSHRMTKEPVIKTSHVGSFDNISRREKIQVDDFRKLGKNAFKQVSQQFKVKVKALAMGDICYLSYGLRPNSDERFWRGEFTRDDLVSEIKDTKHPMPYIEGKNLGRYCIEKVLYLEWGTKRVPEKLVRPTFPELYKMQKLLCGTMTGGTYDNTGVICNHSIVVFVRFVDLCGVENKSISGSLKKFNTLPRRELEKISKGFDLKYLLAILNSHLAQNFLNSIRRHRLENYFYPDDYRKLPVADILFKEQKPFIEIVDKILAITKSGDYLHNSSSQAKVKDYRHQINKMIYKLYGLTKKEIEILEGGQ